MKTPENTRIDHSSREPSTPSTYEMANYSIAT
jgi:hypothetical protein